MARKIALFFFGFLTVWLGWNHELVGYGWSLARGQARIMLNTRPVADVLTDVAVPDSVKVRLRLIEEIKRFAIDSLGLKPSQNFTTFYDLEGKPLMWLLTGAERYRLVAVQNKVPVLGSFPYKGFYDREPMLRADTLLQQRGYDTRIGTAAAYSTLGFFRDPILSSMLDYETGWLAELIIHELTHGTLFVRDKIEYNENLADFVGEYGAKRFLAQRYGPASATYRNYLATKAYRQRYDDHILRGTTQLSQRYASFKPTTPDSVKEQQKWALIGQIMASADTLTDDRIRQTGAGVANASAKKRVLDKLNLPNNAYFVGYLTYRKQQNQFRTEFTTRFGGDFGRYLAYLKQTYPSL
jgi:predicted aminopeptidase